MRRIAIANPKGGSAKTTTTVNIAATLAEQGRTVLVIDLDPQGSASRWLGGVRADQYDHDLLNNGVGVPELVQDTAIPGVSLVPASRKLLAADRHAEDGTAGETRLQQKLRVVDGWDYVLIDCPASLGPLTLNGIAAADEVVAPIEASVLGLMSLANLWNTIRDVRRRLVPGLGPTRILPCRVNTRTRHAREVVEKLREKFGAQVFTHVVRENVRLAECPGFRQPITQYAPQSTGADDYRSIAGELIAGEEG